MIKGLFIIFFFLFLGDSICIASGIPIPGNVIGMLLLTVGLHCKLIKLESVQQTADMLVKNMALLFIPPGVGIMLYFDLIRAELLPILVSYVLSTYAVLVVVGKIQEKLSHD